MSDFRIDQITNQAGTAGPDIAGITTFSGSSGLLMPRGDTFRRSVPENYNIVLKDIVMYLDAGNIDSYPGSGTIWLPLTGKIDRLNLLNGVGYDSSDGGGSLTFDGSNDKVESLQNFSFGNTQQRTYDIWYKSTLGTYQVLIALTANSNDYKWQTITILENGSINYMFGDNSFYNERGQLDVGVNAFGSYIPGLTSSTGEWQNICMTINVNETHPNRIKLYVDGINYSDKINNYNNSGNAIYDGSMYLQFGAANFGQGNNSDGALNGSISNILLYNRALSAAEVSQNYNALKGRYT